MNSMASFVWYTIVIVGILVSSLAMISMGAACWDYCDTVPIIAKYLVITGSVFFCLLILLLLLTFCICTSSGDLKIIGILKIILGVCVSAMYLMVIAGTTVLFVQPEEDKFCNRTRTQNESFFEEQFNQTVIRTADPFCTTTLPVFSYSVLVVFNILLFFSLLVTYCSSSK
ncbi:hypothetical protein JTE90_010478 [Oedothorax gibbosus]|uniref:NADH dehydrogenase subunit 6 n=1 Tax=Oedothorax gibbosus TaxID=931172 RepID=A0AAV6VZS5_9ARAC|nr:hypothetical protein JTE90_010478 [Oedothorax gibbosus]